MNLWRRCLLTCSILMILNVSMLAAWARASTSDGDAGFGLVFQYPPDGNYSLYAQRFGFAWGGSSYNLAQENPTGDYFPAWNLTRTVSGVDWTPDYNYITTYHSDWLLKYKDGSLIGQDDGYYMLDIGNSACVDYIISWVQQALSNWPGKTIGCDNGMFQYADSNWAKYNTDQSYQDAWAYFLGRLSDAFRPDYKIILNVGSCDMSVFERMMGYVDGALFESMGSTTSDLSWVQEYLQKGQWLADNGKIWCARLEVTTDSEAAFLYGYAVIAMAGGSHSYFSLDDQNATTFYYPEMDYNLGSPLGDMKQIVTNVYERDFQNYTVYLNLSASTYTLPNGTKLSSMSGAEIKSSNSGSDYINAYSFKFSYSDGDYYTGTVYASSSYGYSVGYTQIVTDENGHTDTYTITGVTNGQDPSLAGEVFVSSYYDSASGKIYTPVDSTTAIGTSYLGSEHDYIIKSGVPEYRFGSSGGTFYEADLAAYAYTFKLTYGDGDYYTGTVYAAPEYGYSTSYTKTTTDEKGHTDTYTITGVTTGYNVSKAGQVYVTSYYDAGSGKTYTPVSNGTAVGSSYLGSEHDYIIQTGISEFYFGGGYYEAELGSYSRYDFNYYYNDGSGDYYTGYVYAPTSFETFLTVGTIISDQPSNLWSSGYQSLNGGYYYLTAITDGFNSSYDKKEYITSYYDSSLGSSLGVNTDGSDTAGQVYVADRTASWESGYVIYGSQNDTFSVYKQADGTLSAAAPSSLVASTSAASSQAVWGAYYSQTSDLTQENQ